MKLSVIVPVYNEEKTILEILDKVEKVDLGDIKKEIIVVDDCSRDRTREVLKTIKNKKVKIFYHEKNQGKGSSIRTGLNHVTGDIVIIQDADLEYNPQNIAFLLQPILNQETKVVYGSRLLGSHKDMYFLHYVGNYILTLITNLLYGSNITDMETGYKVMDASVIRNIKLKARRFDFEPEITAKILKKGYKIKEIPINFTNPRKFSEGKKITWRDGIKAIYYLLKYRFFN